jgi:N-acetylmuramoyl-L-alanine amidase
MNIIQKTTPNFTKGRVRNGVNYKPTKIVIHIMDGTLAGTDSWFASPSSQVSAHYGIGVNGQIHQYVQEEDQAWHAGVVIRPTADLIPSVNPNAYTIGIEHEGRPLTNDKWTEAMKISSARLIARISEKWGIELNRKNVIGHYEINGNKPNCPALDKKIIDELITLAKKETNSFDLKKELVSLRDHLNEILTRI